MSALPLQRYRVVVLEWLAHETVIEAADSEEAEWKGLALWEDGHREQFSPYDGGVDDVIADDLPEATTDNASSE